MDQYVELAKKSVERYVRFGSVIEPPSGLPAEFYSRQTGVFVTIYKGKKLRGCIGTFLPTKKNLAEEIIYSAVAACSEDYRFDPVREDELPVLSFEVSVLHEPVAVEGIETHDPQQHGIIVQSGRKRGLLLPDIEGVETAKQQIAIAAEKGSIDLTRERVQLFKFSVEKHS